MLEDLKRLHEELLSAIDELECLTGSVDPPSPARLSEARSRISKIGVRKLRFAEDIMYPQLFRSGSAADTAALEQLRRDNAAIRSASSLNVARWPPDKATREWQNYREASSAITTAMRARVLAEKALLYSLLEKGN